MTGSLRKRFRYDVTRASRHWERTTKQLVMASMELGERCAVFGERDCMKICTRELRELGPGGERVQRRLEAERQRLAMLLARGREALAERRAVGAAALDVRLGERRHRAQR